MENRTAMMINEACDAIERAAEGGSASSAVANLCFALGNLNRALPRIKDVSDRRFVQDWIDRADHDLAMARVGAGV